MGYCIVPYGLKRFINFTLFTIMVERVRFINEEPTLALFLSSRKPIILPKLIYDWAVGWVYDIGTTLRSRDMMVSFLVSNLYNRAFQELQTLLI